MIDFANKTDWNLFKRQKEYLIAMANDEDRLTEEVEVLDGIINLMDAFQDAFEPYNIDGRTEMNIDHIDAIAMLENAYDLLVAFEEAIEAQEGDHPAKETLKAWLAWYELNNRGNQ